MDVKAQAEAAVRELHRHGSHQEIQEFYDWYLRYLQRLPVAAGGVPRSRRRELGRQRVGAR